LYTRLGGYERLVRVLDGVSGRLMRHERLSAFFRGHSTTSKQRLSQHFIEFICAQAGGPFHLTGMPLITAHEGLEITHEDFEIFCDLFRESCQKHKLSKAETSELLALVQQFEKDIVQGYDSKIKA
jgi:hemoglobin